MPRHAARSPITYQQLVLSVTITTAAFQFAPSRAIAAPKPPTVPGGSCVALFQGVLLKIPNPSKIAAENQDDVRGRASQAVVVLKASEVLPDGRYEVLVRDSRGQTRPDVLTVKYSLDGVSMSLNSIPLIESAGKEVKSEDGEVTGILVRMRLHIGRVSFINSTFSGNADAASGVVRRDTAVEFDLSHRKPIVLMLKEAVSSTEQDAGSEPSVVFDHSIEVRRRV